MNKKGFSEKDALEWVKVAITLVLGYIIIRAILSSG